MALAMSRWLTRCVRTTFAAPRSAASVFALSPISQWKQRLSGAVSCTRGAPGRSAATASTTTGSSS